MHVINAVAFIKVFYHFCEGLFYPVEFFSFIWENKKDFNLKVLFALGAEGRGRTDTVSLPLDFEFCSITGNIGNVMHFSGSYRPPETL